MCRFKVFYRYEGGVGKQEIEFKNPYSSGLLLLVS